jgi:hypothetical protein
MSKNSKHPDLTPWLDYFKMLQRYEQKGFLEIKPQEHEAYVTRAALLTLSPTPALPEGEGDAANNLPLQGGQRGAALADTLSRLRAYAAYRWAPAVGQQHPADINDPDAEIPVIPIEELTAYFSQPFAVHIVKEEYPHDLLLTLLLQQKRSWYGRMKDVIEVIDYTEQKTEEK